MFLGKKCKGCKGRLKKGEVFSELRVDTAEGLLTMDICPRCADFWDGSAEVLNKRREDEDMERKLPDEVKDDE